MSQVEELLDKSIVQSNSFRDMAFQLKDWCDLLIAEVERLKVENERMKKILGDK